MATLCNVTYITSNFYMYTGSIGLIIGMFSAGMIHNSGICVKMFNGGSPVTSGLHHPASCFHCERYWDQYPDSPPYYIGLINGVFDAAMIHNSGIHFKMFNGGSPVTSGLHHPTSHFHCERYRDQYLDSPPYYIGLIIGGV